MILLMLHASSRNVVEAELDSVEMSTPRLDSSVTDPRQPITSMSSTKFGNSALSASNCRCSATSLSIISISKSEWSSVGCFIASKLLNCTGLSPNSIENIPACTSIFVQAIIKNGRLRIKTDVGMTFIEAPKSNMASIKVHSPMVHGIEKILGSRHFFGRDNVDLTSTSYLVQIVGPDMALDSNLAGTVVLQIVDYQTANSGTTTSLTDNHLLLQRSLVGPTRCLAVAGVLSINAPPLVALIILRPIIVKPSQSLAAPSKKNGRRHQYIVIDREPTLAKGVIPAKLEAAIILYSLSNEATQAGTTEFKEEFDCHDGGMKLSLEFPYGTTLVTCCVSIYDNSFGKKVGMESLMNEAFTPPLLASNIYMEEVQVKLGEELHFTIGSQHIPFGASLQDVKLESRTIPIETETECVSTNRRHLNQLKLRPSLSRPGQDEFLSWPTPFQLSTLHGGFACRLQPTNSSQPIPSWPDEANSRSRSSQLRLEASRPDEADSIISSRMPTLVEPTPCSNPICSLTPDRMSTPIRMPILNQRLTSTRVLTPSPRTNSVCTIEFIPSVWIRPGKELHDQVRGGNYGAKGIQRRSVNQDIVRGVSCHYEIANRDRAKCIGVIEGHEEVYVPAVGYLYGDNHWIILFGVRSKEVLVREGNEGQLSAGSVSANVDTIDDAQVPFFGQARRATNEPPNNDVDDSFEPERYVRHTDRDPTNKVKDN
ncbi:UPF0183 protein, partial [Mucuna pruriens]